MDGSAGFCVEAEDHEGAAFSFVTTLSHTLFGDKNEVILILERGMDGINLRWSEVFRKSNRLQRDMGAF